MTQTTVLASTTGSGTGCVATHSRGHPTEMNDESLGITRTDAEVGGYLLALADGKAYNELTEAVGALISSTDSHPPPYNGVYRWVVSSIADVLVSKLGPGLRGDEGVALTIRTTGGAEVDLSSLEEPESSVMRAVADVLAGGASEARVKLGPVGLGMDWMSRLEMPVEAVLWLDKLLDAPATSTPDTLPW